MLYWNLTKYAIFATLFFFILFYLCNIRDMITEEKNIIIMSAVNGSF